MVCLLSGVRPNLCVYLLETGRTWLLGQAFLGIIFRRCLESLLGFYQHRV